MRVGLLLDMPMQSGFHLQRLRRCRRGLLRRFVGRVIGFADG
jgi:hypothetical protein